MTITAMATRAIHHFCEQELMAEPESVRPMAMIIGPVTIGGKYRITLPVPNMAKSPDITKYRRPAQNTPAQAYGRAWAALRPEAAPIWTTAAYPPMKAKDEPRKAGTLNFVMRWKRRVPIPAKSRVADTDRPVIAGTRTVEPNIANMCCSPRIPIFLPPRVRAS